MKEDAGQKIAEIDAHVGRVSAGLDETMIVLNDRIVGDRHPVRRRPIAGSTSWPSR